MAAPVGGSDDDAAPEKPPAGRSNQRAEPAAAAGYSVDGSTKSKLRQRHRHSVTVMPQETRQQLFAPATNGDVVYCYRAIPCECGTTITAHKSITHTVKRDANMKLRQKCGRRVRRADTIDTR